MTLEDFKKIDLTKYLWVHLEGRNKENLLQILEFLTNQDQVRFSVEVEKVGRGFEEFIQFPDLVLISKVNKKKIIWKTIFCFVFMCLNLLYAPGNTGRRPNLSIWKHKLDFRLSSVTCNFFVLYQRKFFFSYLQINCYNIVFV